MGADRDALRELEAAIRADEQSRMALATQEADRLITEKERLLVNLQIQEAITNFLERIEGFEADLDRLMTSVELQQRSTIQEVVGVKEKLAILTNEIRLIDQSVEHLLSVLPAIVAQTLLNERLNERDHK